MNFEFSILYSTINFKISFDQGTRRTKSLNRKLHLPTTIGRNRNIEKVGKKSFTCVRYAIDELLSCV